jgi:sugar lactone lactonase YvrE
MSKPFPIDTFLQRSCFTLLFLTSLLQVATADDPAADKEAEAPKVETKSESKTDSTDETAPTKEAATAVTSDTGPKYPLMVAVDGNAVYTVDLDLPGVWKTVDGKRELFFAGSKFLRKAMNRPRPIVMHPDGGILVGDSATREIYHIREGDTEGKPLNKGYLGIPMSLAVSLDGKTLYVGDAERRATFKMPIDGVAADGKPELVARVNARGLAMTDEQTLYAATPDADAVVKINLADGKVTPVVTGRPYQYVNSMVWAGDHGYVCDIYAKTIWKFTPDGKTEKWFEGEPLVGPVGMYIDDSSVYVADPKQKQVFQINRETKEVKERF